MYLPATVDSIRYEVKAALDLSVREGSGSKVLPLDCDFHGSGEPIAQQRCGSHRTSDGSVYS
jgi:hypothetical protein